MEIILFLKCERLIGKGGYIEHFLFKPRETSRKASKWGWATEKWCPLNIMTHGIKPSFDYTVYIAMIY